MQDPGSKFVLEKFDLLLFNFPSENSLVTLLSTEVFIDWEVLAFSDGYSGPGKHFGAFVMQYAV